MIKREEEKKMSKTTKLKFFSTKSRVIAIILTIILTMGFIPFGPASSVEASTDVIEIRASELNKAFEDPSSIYAKYIDTSSGGRVVIISDDYGRDVHLIMDQALYLNKLWVNFCNLTISGNGKLTLTDKSEFSKNLTLEQGTYLYLDGQYAKIRALDCINLSGIIELNDAYRICATNDFNLLGGEITGNAKGRVIETENGSINIKAGDIKASSTVYGLYSGKNLVIDGGYVELQCPSNDAIHVKSNFIFNGGELKASTNATGYQKGTVIVVGNITVSDNCFIKVPDNGIVGSNGAYKTITKPDGTSATSVNIKESINLSKATVSGIEDKDYTGSPITQNPVVTYNGTTLKENYHYTVRYENNTNGGTATIYFDSIHENDVSGSLNKTFKIIKHEHKVVIDPAVDATCQKTGLTEGSHCSECGVVLKKREEIPIRDHDYQIVPGSSKQATCTEDGKEYDKKCTMCNRVITGNTLKAKGHIPVTDPEVPATTTSTGLTEGSHCKTCGYIIKKQEVIPMKENTCQHVWDNGVVTKPQTCLEGGEIRYTCTLCKGTKTETTDPLGHNEVIDPAVAPTTTSKGLTEGSHCSRCKVVIIPQDEIPMLEPEEEEDQEKEPVVPEDKKEDKQEDKKEDKQEDKKEDKKENQTNKNQNNNQNNNNKKTNKPAVEAPKYSNEWVNGKWYDELGNCTYPGTLTWKNNATGWWVEDSEGWYPTNQWQKIDGIWYYFKPDGYMAMGEYYDGYWFNNDGSWDSQYKLSWMSNATGWWVEDISGWWPSSSWLKIDGYWYYFDALGYMVTNQYVDGYWISSDGVCY